MNLGKELAGLERMTVPELRGRYAEVFGEPTRAHNRPWLIKRIAWRLQAIAEGDLSQRAKRRAAELANDADLRLIPPKETEAETTAFPGDGDDRLPQPGAVLQREYKGRMLLVTVLATGFEFEGETFKSLSAVAKKITGTHCNGFHFFRLAKEAAR